MINTMEDFKRVYPKAVIVNYDTVELFDCACGMTYRTDGGSVELFRKDKLGKRITYPSIQPYLVLSDNSDYELFIIYNSKMYQLEQGSKENSYKIKKELTNVSPLISKDDVFYDTKRRREPRNNIDEPIYTIEK